MNAKIIGLVSLWAIGCGGSTLPPSASGGAEGGAAGSSGKSGAGGASCGGNCGFSCCGSECINTNNDLHNCGQCGTVCPASTPYCDNGKCAKPPCESTSCAAGTTCCMNECCAAGELCCEVNAGASRIGCFPATDTGTCPLGCAQCVCTAPTTPIATPTGERAISELRAGDLVYSVERGAIAVVPILLVNRVPVTGIHHMVEVRLSTGKVLSISPSHPTADGRTFSDLRAGQTLDGVELRAVNRVPYTEAYTYDILPSSDSGTYFAGGVLIGSTLTAPRAENQCRPPTAALSLR